MSKLNLSMLAWPEFLSKSRRDYKLELRNLDLILPSQYQGLQVTKSFQCSLSHVKIKPP